MSPRSRSLLVPVLVVLAPILLVVGIWLGGHSDNLPAFARNALVGDRDTQAIQQAISIIERDYYRKVGARSLINRGLGGAVASLRDPYTQYFDPADYRSFAQQTNGQFSGVGIDVRRVARGLRVQRSLPKSPARRAGIRAGDVVVAVDDRSIAGRTLAAAAALIQGRAGTGVGLAIVRAGRRRVVRVRRAVLPTDVVVSKLRVVRGVKLGYVAFGQFTAGIHGQLRSAVARLLRRGARGVAVDLRDNGGGLLQEAVLVASAFIPQGPIVSTEGRTRPRKVYDATGDAIASRVPLVVLVDRRTASAAEIVAAALQERRHARVVGTRTFGKGVFQDVENLDNGGALKLTVGEYFTPNGINLGGGGVKEGRGLAPDVAVGDSRRTLAVGLRTLAGELR